MKLILVALSFIFCQNVLSQQITIGDNKGALTFEEYDPKTTLVVDKNPKTRSQIFPNFGRGRPKLATHKDGKVRMPNR